MILSFVLRYPKNPICLVSSTTHTARVFATNPENDFVKVFILYVNGTAAFWMEVTFRLGCFGAMERKMVLSTKDP
jgi:hypothetical protein